MWPCEFVQLFHRSTRPAYSSKSHQDDNNAHRTPCPYDAEPLLYHLLDYPHRLHPDQQSSNGDEPKRQQVHGAMHPPRGARDRRSDTARWAGTTATRTRPGVRRTEPIRVSPPRPARTRARVVPRPGRGSTAEIRNLGKRRALSRQSIATQHAMSRIPIVMGDSSTARTRSSTRARPPEGCGANTVM